MGFLDKAKAMADELAQKADTALSESGLGGPGGGADRYFRDLGVIAYLEASGRPVSDADRERVMGALRDLEQRGEIGALTLKTSAAPSGAVPPPPGSAGQTPPPPGDSAPPTGPAATPPPGPTTPPPPPPSWARDEDR